MARKHPIEEHLRLRAGIFVYYRRIGGQTKRISLHTRDRATAIAAALKLDTRFCGKRADHDAWESAIAQYIEDKLSGYRPPHLQGHRLRTMRPRTAYKTASILRVFAQRVGKGSPQELEQKDLQNYYRRLRANSEASAQSTLNRISAFLAHIGCDCPRACFDMGARLEVGERVITFERAAELIEACTDDHLKFLLIAGFCHGLRLDEIVMARCGWFDFKQGVLTVPAKEKQRQVDNSNWQWLIKDSETRNIPIMEQYAEWLEKFLGDRKGYCVKPELVKKKAETYRWDATHHFEVFMVRHGERSRKNSTELEPKRFSPHDMRRSFITNLCNSGLHELHEIAAWSGDSAEVIQRYYWKKRVVKGATAAAWAGKRRGDDMKALEGSVKTLSTRMVTLADLDAFRKELLEKVEEGRKKEAQQHMEESIAQGRTISFARALAEVTERPFWRDLREQLGAA